MGHVVSTYIPDTFTEMDTLTCRPANNGGKENLDPLPPKRKRKDIMRRMDVSLIDNHALKAPDELRQHIKELVSYLVEPAKDNLGKVRAFYRWITNNISYDTEGYISEDKCDTTSATVLTSKKTVSEGYCQLFEDFCRLQEIPVTQITGHAKDFRWEPGMNISNLDDKDHLHVWNAVYILGEWRFVECTWGAGYIDKYGTFCFSFKEFYFFTNPEDFIVDHFPYFDNNLEISSLWQLLKKPLTLEQFSTRLHLKPVAIEQSLHPASHQRESALLKPKEDIRFTFQKYNFRSFLGYLRSKDGHEKDQYIQLEMSDNKCLTIHQHIPDTATYFLDLYGAPHTSDAEDYEVLLTYRVKCSAGADAKSFPYPKHQKVWGPCSDYKRYGFTDQVAKQINYVAVKGQCKITLQTSKKTEIIAKLEHAEESIANPKKYCFIRNRGTTIEISVRMLFEGNYKLTIGAQRPWTEETHFWDAITYLIQCACPMSPCAPFPEQYNKTQHIDVQLLEPTDGNLPPNSKIYFRIRASTLQRIIAYDTLLRKDKDLFHGIVLTPEAGVKFVVFGSLEAEDSIFDGLFKYEIVK